jgi:hypothetical protein
MAKGSLYQLKTLKMHAVQGFAHRFEVCTLLEPCFWKQSQGRSCLRGLHCECYILLLSQLCHTCKTVVMHSEAPGRLNHATPCRVRAARCVTSAARCCCLGLSLKELSFGYVVHAFRRLAAMQRTSTNLSHG